MDFFLIISIYFHNIHIFILCEDSGDIKLKEGIIYNANEELLESDDPKKHNLQQEKE